MSRWILVCMLAALICGNQSISQYDDVEVIDSPSFEIAQDTDSYNSDTQHSASKLKPRGIKRHQTPAHNKIKPILPYHTTDSYQMAGLYPGKFKHTAKSNNPISDLIFQKDMLPLDSIETFHPPNKKSEIVDERSKRSKSAKKREKTRTTSFKKGQEHNSEYSSGSSFDESSYREPKRIPKLVTVKQEMHKNKKEHEIIEESALDLHESELDASNDKFISNMKKENANMLRVTKKKYHDKHKHKHENKGKRSTKPDRLNKREPERISSTTDKIHKHKVDPRLDFVVTGIEQTSKESKPYMHHGVKQHIQQQKHKENQHVLKPEPIAHLSLADTLRQNKEPHKHKGSKKKPVETQMNSLELEDAMAKPNGLIKPFEGDADLKDEFTLTVVDINDTSKQQKSVYKFRNEGNEVPMQNVIPPINMAAAEKGSDYSVPLVPMKIKTNNKKVTTSKPQQLIVPLPEVEIGVHDGKNEHKLNSSVQKTKREKGKVKNKEKASDVSNAELHLTSQSSEESDDEFAYIGYLSDKHNRAKKLKELLRDASGQSTDRKLSRKSWLSCLGKKALKICIKSCNAAYKIVCKRLKCSSKAKKDLKNQCKKSCKKVFKFSNGKKSGSSGSSSDSSF